MRTYRLNIPAPRAADPAWTPEDLSLDEAPTPKPKQIYTVTELTREIKGLLEQAFALVWVEGEVSEPKYHPNGHLFFLLKDPSAGLKAVVWRDTVAHLKFTLEQGLQVICCGRISVFAPQGAYQLYVDYVEPKGLGALQLAFEQLCRRLEQEGLFDPARKRPLPVFPQGVGIVTSPSGAAVDDLLRILRGHVRVLLYPTRVQGDGAAAQIARGIEILSACDDLDCLIVGRGGGSLEDRWAFNEEVVARAIAASRLPVISAVGHEKDTSVSDLVADVRAPTPTKAAELIVAQRSHVLRRLLDVLADPTMTEPETWLAGLQERVDEAHTGVAQGMTATLSALADRLRLAHARVWQNSPQALVERHAQRLAHLHTQLKNHMLQALERGLQQFLGFTGRLQALSPLAVLARGYSITFDAQGRILRRARQVTPGATIRTRVHDGQIISRVARTMDEVAHAEDQQ